MKNPLRPGFAPLVTLFGAAVAAVLRLWLFATGIDAKGLLMPAHFSNTAMFVLTALALGAIFLCLAPISGKAPYRGLFPASPFAAVGNWIAAAGIGITLFLGAEQPADSAGWLYLILGALAVISFIILGACRLKGIRPNPFFHGLITLHLIFRLIHQYRHWNTEPQLQVYFFQMLALVFLMLSAYHLATLDANIGNIKNALFFRYGAVFFCCFSACEEAPAFYGALALWLLLSGSLDVFEVTDKMALPEQVDACIEKLNDAGFEAYAVGGCVRDALLGLTPQDYDLCTNASPAQICKIFRDHQLVRSGEKHGTIGVVMDGQVYEITTFRTEGGYSDSRHPDWVKFVNDVRADLSRRDFTVNAMAYSPICGYVDPFGGRQDLEDNILRTVGDPTQRFTEDALRILRGARFAARYGLLIHPETEDAMFRLADTMESLAPERIFAELSKLLLWAKAEDLIRFAPIITRVIPELAPAVGFEQRNPHHSYDVYTHTAYVVENVEADLALKLAALLHDAGKPEAFTLDETGCGHFYDHASASAKIADTVMQRLRASTALREQVVFLVEQHMLPFEVDKKVLRRRISKFGPEAVQQLLQLQKADFCSKGTDEDAAHFCQLETLLEEILKEDACLSIRDLAVDGNDLMEAGIPAGPELGQALEALLEMVLDEKVANEKEALLSAIQNNKE